MSTPDYGRQVASWAKKAREALARRDDAIRAMHHEGASLREIAARAGISHVAVSKILKRLPSG